MPEFNRRQFVAGSLGLGAALAAGRRLVYAEDSVVESADGQPPTFVAFTESFQGWPIPEVCRKFKEIGLDGLDLTVRPGGHIEPANAAKELPQAVKAARDAGVQIAMLSTAITEVDPVSEELVATAGSLGIDRIKLGYYRYTQFGKLVDEINAAKTKIAEVARMAARHGVLPCVHIHSGDTIPSGGAVAYLLLKDFAPHEVGAYVDPMHMTVEGGNDGWRQGLDLLAPWIAISSLKNCQWTTTERDQQGQMRWKFQKCPLADGIANIPQYLERLRELGYNGLFTLHSEYSDRGSWKVLNADECLEQTKRDLEFVKSIL